MLFLVLQYVTAIFDASLTKYLFPDALFYLTLFLLYVSDFSHELYKIKIAFHVSANLSKMENNANSLSHCPYPKQINHHNMDEC